MYYKFGDVRLFSSRFASLILTFLSIPVLLKYSGANVLGSYYFLYAIFNLVSIFDLGIGNGLIGLIAQKNAPDRRNFLFKGLANLLIFSCFYIVILLVLSHFLIGYFIDRLTFGEVKHFSSALLLIITLGLLNNFGNLGLKYKSATGKYSFTVYFETFSVFVGIALTLIVLSIKPNLLTLVIGLVGVPTLMSLVHLCSIMRGFEFRAEVASLFYNKKLELNRYIIQGRLFLVLQITTVISLQIDSLIIGSILGPNEVASVSIIWKLFSVPYLLLVSATGGLWSLASSLSGQEKETIIQNIMWKNIKYTFAYSVFFGIVFFILGKKLVHLFVPDLPVPSQSFLLISILLLVSMCVAQPIAMILNGLHKEKFLITASVTGMLVNFISSVFFVNKFHEGFGALLGTAVAQIFCFVIPALLIYKPWLKGKGTI